MNPVKQSKSPNIICVILSIIFIICIYMNNYKLVWQATSYVEILVGILLAVLFIVGRKSFKKIWVLFLMFFSFGAIVLIFQQNISRMRPDLGVGFFDKGIYYETIGILLASFQIITVISILVLILCGNKGVLHRRISMLFVFLAGVSGVLLSLYNIYFYRNASDYIFREAWRVVAIALYFLLPVIFMINKKRDA